MYNYVFLPIFLKYNQYSSHVIDNDVIKFNCHF